ncbi:MAG: DMT family transporter [Rhizobiaceae bacterium]
MIFLTFSWGLNGAAQKLSNLGFNPVFTSVFRSALGALLVYFWCVARGIPLFNRDGTLPAGLLAGFLFGAEFLLIFIGFDYTSLGRGSLMVNTMPFWVLIGAHFLLGERMSLARLFGVALAFGGVVVIFSDKLGAPGPDAWIGDLLTLAAGVLWGATSLVIKGSRLNNASAEKLLLYQLVVSAAMSAPLLLFAGPMFRAVSALSIGALLFQAIFVVAFTYLVWFWLMRRYPASGLASFAFLTPAFSVLIGAVLLGEPLTWKIGLALILIAGGLIIVNRPTRTPG